MAAARGRNREGRIFAVGMMFRADCRPYRPFMTGICQGQTELSLPDLPTEPFGRSRFLKARPIPFCRERICICAVRFSARVLHRLGNAKREDALVSGGIYLS